MSSIFISPIFHPLDGNGKGYPAAKLYAYEAGTLVAAPIYSDNALSTAITQPVIADAAGRFEQIYLGSDLYKFVLHTAGDVEIGTWDDVANMIAGDGGLLPVASGGTAAATAANARTNLGAASQSDYTALNTILSAIDTDYQAIGGTLGDLAALDDIAVSNIGGVMKIPVQRAFHTSNSSTSMNITDGTQYDSQSFTPLYTGSTILVTAMGRQASGASYKFGIFVTGTTPAIEAITTQTSSGGAVSVMGEVTSPSTAAMTFSVRCTGAITDLQLMIEEFVTTPI